MNFSLNRDALLISITDALTSIFSGAVVFAIIGYLSHEQGKEVDDPSIATDGIILYIYFFDFSFLLKILRGFKMNFFDF